MDSKGESNNERLIRLMISFTDSTMDDVNEIKELLDKSNYDPSVPTSTILNAMEFVKVAERLIDYIEIIKKGK